MTTIDAPAPVPAARLSKSRVLLGAQCPRLLWWAAHEPDAPELAPDPGTALRFAQGHEVGEEARRRFPGGVLVDLPHTDVEGRIATTQALLDAGARVIFEASFRFEGVFVAVDVLVRQDDGSFELLEVKSTTRLKPEHVLDVAVQRAVLEGCGLRIARAGVMHLNTTCVYPDLTDLFVVADVTDESRDRVRDVLTLARALRRTLAGPLPDVDPGAQCDAPRTCPFFDRCHDAQPAHHVTTLYRIGGRAQELVARGIETIDDVPLTGPARVKLTAVAERQVRAVKARRMIVEPGLTDALDAIEGPVAVLDLETVGFAIPRHTGASPYAPVPVQASIHVLDDGGDTVHHAFLADERAPDPRAPLASFLVDVLADARSVLCWNASFERRCILALADVLPRHARALRALADKLVDLLPVVRDHVAHPDFGGSFSLKRVAPALVPHVGYDGLAIADGDEAGAALYRLLTHTLADDERQRVREDLLAYCAVDTKAVAAIWLALQRLARKPARQKRRA